MSRHRLGSPVRSGSLSQVFDIIGTPTITDFGSGETRGGVAPGDPAGLCELLPPIPRAACRLAAGVFFGDDDDPLTDPTRALQPDDPCPLFTSRDPITRECRFDIDPGPGQGFPGGNGAAGGGLTRPTSVSRRVLECPRFADGKTGILWMNALTGDVICLPRRTSGRGFGLIRKNKPRKKAFISAAQKKSLDDIKRVQGKAKKFAEDAGFSCKKR